MEQPDPDATGDRISRNLYRPGQYTGTGDVLDLSGTSEDDLGEISELMNALARLREAEALLSEASRKYMKLSALDMRALHYLIVAKSQGEIVTPGMIASHLHISAASTTKLLNRLERGKHIVRQLHPRDRRAIMIQVTPDTENAARQSVGRQQAKRFYAAARLTSSERATVTRFLEDMAQEISLDDVSWAHETDPPQPAAGP